MGYRCEWATGQSVDLENVDEQTRVTLTNSSPGQQQQSSNHVQTGRWTAPPEIWRVAIGLVVKLLTAQGEQFIYIQGNQVSTSTEAPSWGDAQPLPVHVDSMPAAMSPKPSMAPMLPLPPMKMGDMQMDQTTMTMQMGNMRMEMNPIKASSKPSPQTGGEQPSTSAVQRNFCSQCGSTLKPSDRFCAHCGHRLD
ncbi:zinc ribbon domain-containing protein [Phormidium sp. FACHB-592]|uniref:Zinc ribbon domain-containing protein n=1 Tax=Stenomitos frigidus AS-A4 TaxID=2933935 RepID=A0ABV0KCC4_9CYAN|nr:zinc ribbon domain-containing protein [Phormidium sp. FACHB-592]MBD2077514.1 zinc ribbon domain-containing protein [Phormidium sp. FACHB-592]